MISTTTEAVKDLIVGVGCRRGARRRRDRGRNSRGIVAGRLRSGPRATVGLRRDQGRRARIAVRRPGELGLPLRLVAAEEIRHTARAFEHSDFVQEKVDLPAVAEPAALLAGRRTQLLLPKQILHGVTVAIARENCMSLE